MQQKLGVTERRACAALGQSRGLQRKEPKRPDDEERLTADIIRLARQYGRYGYKRITALLRVEGWAVNHKRVERIWRQEALKVPQKHKKKGRLSLVRSSQHFEGYSFIREWSELLDLPTCEIRRLLASRSETMTRLRLSSPFILADGVDFSNTALRRRIWRAARRVARASPTFAEPSRMVA